MWNEQVMPLKKKLGQAHNEKRAISKTLNHKTRELDMRIREERLTEELAGIDFTATPLPNVIPQNNLRESVSMDYAPPIIDRRPHKSQSLQEIRSEIDKESKLLSRHRTMYL